jgi:hypothetical protein
MQHELDNGDNNSSTHAPLEFHAPFGKIGKQEGAEVLIGGQAELLEGEYGSGYYIQPTTYILS